MATVEAVRPVRKRVRIGAPDPSLTGCSGLAALTEFADLVGFAPTLDRHVGPIKRRRRGLTAGEFLLSLGTAQLCGEDAWVGMDRQRADVAGQSLGPVPTPGSTTAALLAGRFGPQHLAGAERGLAALVDAWMRRLPAQVRALLAVRAPTIDMDSTEVEVYGRHKDGVAYNYAGQLAGRPHIASWAQAALPLAADLLAGNEDVRPRAGALLRRALAGLPKQGCGRARVRADAGYFCAELAQAAVDAEADFAIAAKRNPAMWRAYAGVPDSAWMPARDMPGAQVTAVDYAPEGWPPGTYTIIRRVRVNTVDVSGDARSRRRRTIPKDQLKLALDGCVDHVWAVSFIVTNIPADDGPDIVGIEAWFRCRTDIEERIREAKLGAGLRHLPSASRGVNTVWMWGALFAGVISVMIQSLIGLDTERGRVRAARFRHELLRVPARVIRHARGLTLRLPPGRQLLPEVLTRLRELPAAA